MMQFFTFAFFSLVAIIFIIIKICNTFIENENAKIITANSILLAASYIFIIYADFRFALAIGALTVVTWFCAKKEKLIPIGSLSWGTFNWSEKILFKFSTAKPRYLKKNKNARLKIIDNMKTDLRLLFAKKKLQMIETSISRM